MAFRCIVFIALASAAISSCQTTGTATDALVGASGSVEKRQIESRIFEVSDDKLLIRTIVATLQDFGFEIRESNLAAGLVSGSKSQKDGRFYGINSDVRVTIATTQVINRTSTVRANFQKIIPSHDPRLYRTEPILDATLYQNFFNSVEQSLFLMRNEQ